MTFTKLCDPDYTTSRFHVALAAKLERVARGECRRLIVSVPPRHGKSRLTSIELPSWMLGRNPRLKCILASYSASLASHHSKAVRERIETSDAYRAVFPETRVKRDDRSSSDWQTSWGGNFLAAGVGSSITGRGADLIVLDDPFKDYEEAHSETVRENVWNWFLSTLYTRQSPGCSIVIITTRWHPDDIVGRLMRPEMQEAVREAGGDYQPWELVNLPGIAKEDDWLGREPGEALFPERFPVAWVRGQMAVLGSYLAAALYDGSPVPKGGKYISGRKLIRRPASEMPPGRRQVRYWDLAATEKSTSDFTAGARGFLDDSGNLWVTNITRGQWAWPRSRQTISTLAQSEKGEVGVEAQAGFRTAADNLREVLPPDVYLKAVTVDRDKLSRALPWIAMAENSRVFLVEGPWVNDFVTEVDGFPDGAHDDQVDAVSGLYSMLRSPGLVMA